MGVYSIHFSPTGGTKTVADIICGALDGDFNEIDVCSNIEHMSLCEEDICLISVPSYGGRVPATAVERLKLFMQDLDSSILMTRTSSGIR